jgi:SAM-dependent methyltransferase
VNVCISSEIVDGFRINWIYRCTLCEDADAKLLNMPANLLLNRILERCWEWRLGINTRGHIETDQLGLRNDAVSYSPIPFRAFFRAMKHVPNEMLSGTFLDYGAGKGRALILAARYYNFRRVVGVEMSAELHREAVRNLKHAGARQAEIICTDAATYQPPCDTTVFFLFNPFFGETMKRVALALHKSLVENPRHAAIVVCNARNFLEATAGQDWLTEKAAGKMPRSLGWRVFITRPGDF